MKHSRSMSAGSGRKPKGDGSIAPDSTPVGQHPARPPYAFATTVGQTTVLCAHMPDGRVLCGTPIRPTHFTPEQIMDAIEQVKGTMPSALDYAPVRYEIVRIG